MSCNLQSSIVSLPFWFIDGIKFYWGKILDILFSLFLIWIPPVAHSDSSNRQYYFIISILRIREHAETVLGPLLSHLCLYVYPTTLDIELKARIVGLIKHLPLVCIFCCWVLYVSVHSSSEKHSIIVLNASKALETWGYCVKRSLIIHSYLSPFIIIQICNENWLRVWQIQVNVLTF